MGRFAGKTVLVTGASRGQGASHARGFAAEGANVVLVDVLVDEGRELAAALENALFIELDVRDAAGWQRVVEQSEARFGPISVLINNAGIIQRARTIAETDPDEWDAVIDTNLKGPFLAIRAVGPSLARAGGGAIVNIASNQGHVGTAMFSAYVSSKWAVRGLTMTAAAELARDGIRVNSISPGVVRTPLITEPVAPGEKPAVENVVLDSFAVPRTAEPDEITRLVLFLASDDASFTTGADYLIDGGMLLGPVLPKDG